MLPQTSQRRHVVLVDDDDSLRRALARAIRVAGFDVATFGSAEALLAHGIDEGTACLVLDIDLPGMKGTELQHQLAGARRHDLRTIFITALGPEEANQALAALQPVTVLLKPFDRKELIEAIARVCAQG